MNMTIVKKARMAFCGMDEPFAENIKRKFAQTIGCEYPPAMTSLADYVKTAQVISQENAVAARTSNPRTFREWRFNWRVREPRSRYKNVRPLLKPSPENMVVLRISGTNALLGLYMYTGTVKVKYLYMCFRGFIKTLTGGLI